MDSLKNLSIQLLVSFIGAGIISYAGNLIKILQEEIVDIQFCEEFELETEELELSYYSVFNSGTVEAEDVYVEISIDKSVPSEAYRFIRLPGVKVKPEKEEDSDQTLYKRYKVYRDKSNGDNTLNLEPGDYFGFAIQVERGFGERLIKSIVVNPSRSAPNEYEPRRIYKKLKFRLIMIQFFIFIIAFLVFFILINLVNWIRVSRFSEFSKNDISTIRDIITDHKAMTGFETTESKKDEFTGALNKSKSKSRPPEV